MRIYKRLLFIKLHALPKFRAKETTNHRSRKFKGLTVHVLVTVLLKGIKRVKDSIGNCSLTIERAFLHPVHLMN